MLYILYKQFFIRKMFKKKSLQNPKTLRKCKKKKKFQPQMFELQSLKALAFPRAL